MKIWTDRNGRVRSNGSGSIEKQHAELVKILSYLQRRIIHLESVVSEADARTVRVVSADAKRKAGKQSA